MLKILFSGPPCSGKTTLINKILKQQTKLPLNIDINATSTINANAIRQIKGQVNKENLLVHYDNMRPYKRQQPFDVSSDYFLKYLADISTQDELIVITLLTPLKCLSERINERIKRLSIESKLNVHRREKLQQILFLYEDKSEYLKQIESWLNFSSLLRVKSHYFYIETPDKNNTFIPTKSLHNQVSLLTELYL